MNKFRFKKVLTIMVTITVIVVLSIIFINNRKTNEYKAGDIVKNSNLTYKIYDEEGLILDGICDSGELQIKSKLYAVITNGEEYKDKGLTIVEKLKNIGCFIIPKNAFLNNKFIEDLTIIGRCQVMDNAFENCTNLRMINTISKVKLGKRAFFNCSALKEVKVDKDKGSIDLQEGVFNRCVSLKKLDLSRIVFINYNKKVFESPFAYCDIEEFIFEIDDLEKSKTVSRYKLADEVLFYSNYPIYYSPSLTILKYGENDKINNIIGCNENVEEIIVSDSHLKCKSINGAVYNKEGTELLVYPNARNPIDIESSVRTISNGAFVGRFKADEVVIGDVKYDAGAFLDTNLQPI